MSVVLRSLHRFRLLCLLCISTAELSTEKPNDSYVRSFARGLSVIRTFNAERREQTLSEVAETMDLTRAGARRILLTLVSLSYVTFKGRLFCLAPKILDLRFTYLTSIPFQDLAELMVEELVQTVHESCSASVLDGTEAVYVLRMPTQGIVALNLSVDSCLPAFCTSMGHVLLSGLSEDRLDIALREPDHRVRTQRTITDVDALKEVIAGVRQQGWALVDQELEEGLISLSAPIRNRAGDIIAVMSIGSQVNRTSGKQMTKQFLGPLQQIAEHTSAMARVRTWAELKEPTSVRCASHIPTVFSIKLRLRGRRGCL